MKTSTTYPLPGFPVEYLAEDGQRFVIRAMQPEDKAALLDFFGTLSEHDRFYLKDDVCSELVVDQWTKHMDYRRAIPLLAMAGDRIAAQGVLHHRRAGARRHIGEVRIVVDPAYRDKGVGRGVLHQLAGLADGQDIERLVFEVVADVEEPARYAAMMVGFVPAAVFKQHVKDKDGKAHDLISMEMNVSEQFPPLPKQF